MRTEYVCIYVHMHTQILNLTRIILWPLLQRLDLSKSVKHYTWHVIFHLFLSPKATKSVSIFVHKTIQKKNNENIWQIVYYCLYSSERSFP